MKGLMRVVENYSRRLIENKWESLHFAAMLIWLLTQANAPLRIISNLFSNQKFKVGENCILGFTSVLYFSEHPNYICLVLPCTLKATLHLTVEFP